MPADHEIAKIDKVQTELQALLDETSSPAVFVSLRHAVYYCHLAKSFLGDDGLSPELDRIYKDDRP
ncbi:MAG: hypothetical protein ACM3IH_17430 [Sphingobacteriales bacterium]|jgi:hypothetical protein